MKGDKKMIRIYTKTENVNKYTYMRISKRIKRYLPEYSQDITIYPIYDQGKTDIIGIKVTVYGTNCNRIVGTIEKILHLEKNAA